MRISIQEYLNLQNITIDMSPPEGLTDFYGPYVSGVSCIIGKNGSGKSNILEYIIKEHNNPDDLILIYHAPIINQRIIKAHISNFYDCSERLRLDQYYKNLGDNNLVDSVYEKKDLDTIDRAYDLILTWSLLYQIDNFNDVEAEAIYKQILVKIDIDPTDLINTISSIFKTKSSRSHLILNEYFILKSNYLKKLILILIIELNSRLRSIAVSNSSMNNLENDFDFKKYIESYSNKFIDHNLAFDFTFIDGLIDNYLKTLKGQKEYIKLFNLIDYFEKHVINSEEDIVMNKNQALKMLLEYLIYTESNKIMILYKPTNSTFVFSSGDTAYFSFIGRVIFELNKLVAEGRCKFLLLLDEVDVALHPKRQKALFKKIMDNINKIGEHILKSKNVKLDIKLLITSHSPFLASDVPLKNIVYLDEKGSNTNNNTYTIQHNDIENSFAANIHMLYKNSFYLENGLIGDFAVDKIEGEIIPYLKGDKKNEDTSTLMKYIKLIADPVLRERMLEEYIKKFGTDNSSKEEIRELIKILESKLNK